MGKLLAFVKKEKLVIAIFLLALVLRLRFLAPWLEDWDSVQFALALHNFSIVDHQPHAPGYPIYVLLARTTNLVLKNDILTLTLMSATLGSLIVFPLYFLSKRMFNSKTALIGVLLFIFLPVEWTLSEVALTNIPGLFFLVVLAYFLYRSLENPRYIIFLSMLFGLMLGIRFTELPIIIGLLALVLVKQKNIKYLFMAITAFLVGVILWMVPTAIINGPREFLEGYGWIANYVINHDALLGKTFSPLDLLQKRLENLWYLLQNGYTFPFLLFSVFSLIWLTFKNYWKNVNYQFFGIWLLAYALPLLTIYNLEVTRYTLPLAPPLVVLGASVLARLTNRNFIAYFLFLLLVVGLAHQSFSQVKRFHKTLPPTIAPVLYVKENFDPQNTIILTSFTYRQFQYYAPEFQVFYAGRVNRINVLNDKILIIDYLGLKDKVEAEKFTIIETKEFRGPRDIFPRVPETALYILRSQNDRDKPQ